MPRAEDYLARDIEIKVLNFDSGAGRTTESLNKSFIEFTEWINQAKLKIPEEYLATAKIEVGAYNPYSDSIYTTIRVWYVRPETQQEIDARIEHIKEREEATKKNELAQLRNLIDKYQVVSISAD